MRYSQNRDHLSIAVRRHVSVGDEDNNKSACVNTKNESADFCSLFITVQGKLIRSILLVS